MKNWMTPALATIAVAIMSHAAVAQEQMSKPVGKAKTYTGCIAAGDMPGRFTLTNPMAVMAMGGDAMKKDRMGKDAMGKPIMIESKTIDLAKHVGHKVSVTGPDGAIAMGKPDAMSKDPMRMSAWSVTTLKMVAGTCGM